MIIKIEIDMLHMTVSLPTKFVCVDFAAAAWLLHHHHHHWGKLYGANVFKSQFMNQIMALGNYGIKC